MKRIALTLIVLFLSLNLFCQVHWTKYENNPVMVAKEEWEGDYVLPRSVIYLDSMYHMWYWGAKDDNLGYPDYPFKEAIGYAISPDGINWTKDPNNPVLEPGPEGAWDDHIIHGCSVILHDSIFHMWYNGHSGQDIEKNWGIGHATSPDGIFWSKDTNNPVMVQGQVGEWDELLIELNSVIHDGDNFQMWYNGAGYKGGQWCGRAGHAISPDGVNWMEDSLNPILIPEYNWEGKMVFYLNTVFDCFNYKMWYTGGSGYNWEVGYATSDDGSIWEKHDHNPVFSTGPAGSWDQKHVGAGPVIDSAGVKYKMWYVGGQTDDSQRIGYAESDTRVPYVLVIENKPVYDSTDTVVAEIVLDGTIYIVPEGTSILVDSIIKYSMASADVLANTETEIPLTDLSVGKYSILGVTSMGFVSTNSYLLEVVENARPPDLTLEDNTVKQGDTIYVTSNKDGTIYLVVTGTTPENFVKGRVRDSVQVSSDNLAEMYTVDLYPKDYLLYAVDNYGQFSASCVVTVKLVDGIENNKPGHFALFPNPVEDLLTVQASFTGSHLVEITSLNGQVVYSTVMEGTSHQIDLSTFQKGVYFITFRSKDYVTTRKIIKM